MSVFFLSFPLLDNLVKQSPSLWLGLCSLLLANKSESIYDLQSLFLVFLMATRLRGIKAGFYSLGCGPK